jgi:hypothetical protein
MEPARHLPIVFLRSQKMTKNLRLSDAVPKKLAQINQEAIQKNARKLPKLRRRTTSHNSQLIWVIAKFPRIRQNF